MDLKELGPDEYATQEEAEAEEQEYLAEKSGFWTWARENPISTLIAIIVVAWSIEGIVVGVARAFGHP